MFTPEGWKTGDLEALEFNEPVQLHIDYLEDSEITTFNKDDLFKADYSKEKRIENAQLL
jgi:hypothetical protein